MSSDRSRSTMDRRYQYTGVVTQQGRVVLDRDFNALQQIVNDRTADDALDAIGPCGTPDNGFQISLPVLSPPPSLWQPPSPLSPPSARHAWDFLVAPGTMYLGGQRVVFAPRQAGHPITYSYFDQPDFIAPNDPLPAGQGVVEAVYLDVVEKEVSAVEDPDLLDVALGGVDTTQRLRLIRRIRRRPVAGASDCAGAWADVTSTWTQFGLAFDPDTMRLVPQASLQVSFTQTQVVSNPCDPVASGGYLGADNQLIRVQIADPGSATRPAQLLWGYDNASFMYRVAAVAANGSKLQLTQDPPDTFHIPQTGQVVEILRTAVILDSEPDETDPTGQRNIVRCIAEPSGVVRTLTQPYGAATAGDPKYLVLDTPLPPEYLNDTDPLFVRVWQAQLPISRSGAAVTLTDQVGQASTGLVVTITVPKGGVLPAGAYWMIGVRPSTPQAVYPERLLVEPQAPDGPREWACPLAVINWGTGAISDCRSQFDNLVALSKRKPGCCTVSVRADDITPDNTLQAVIDRAAGLAASVTVCLGPGTYQLPSPLRLGAQHSAMIIEGCPGGAIIAAQLDEAKGFMDGLIVLTQANHVTLRGLTLTPAQAVLPPGVAKSFNLMGPQLQKQVDFPSMEAVVADITVMLGIRSVNSFGLVVEDCNVEFGTPTGHVFGAGILATGECSELTVRGCRFVSIAVPTATPRAILSRALFTAVPTPVIGAVALPPVAESVSANFLSAVGSLAAPARIVSGLTDAQRPFVALFGCIVAPFAPTLLQNDSTNYPYSTLPHLCDTELSGNDFYRLTLPLLSIGNTGTVRLRDNDAGQCVGGFWLRFTTAKTFSTGEASLDIGILYAAMQLDETFIGLMLAMIYPLPADVSKVKPRGLDRPLLGITPMLLASNNCVEQIALQGTSSLLIIGDRLASPTDPGAALVIANNRIGGRMAPFWPAAFVVYAGRCAITGNLIAEETPVVSPPSTTAYSLLLDDVSGNANAHMTVTGNVLTGITNLAQLVRPDSARLNVPAPLNTWLYWNSTV